MREALRHKTYLPPSEQWERSVELVLLPQNPCAEVLLGKRRLSEDIYLARIRGHHHLFVPGDFGFFTLSNGGAERDRIWAVSSKGYRVRGCYIQYQRIGWRPSDRRIFRSPGDADLLELPDDLAGLLPSDPAVRRHVAALRAGTASPGRRE